ncbi:MAG: M91 family zinc metallopeptidase [Myxococcota bacterium]
MPIRKPATPKVAAPTTESRPDRVLEAPAASNAAIASQVEAPGEESTFLGGLLGGRGGTPGVSSRDQRDRNAAKSELASRFQLVPDDYRGRRLPHQVTQAEWEQITTLYSDIRRGHTSIDFDNTGSGMRSGAFRDAVMGDMADLLTTEQGRALLTQVARDEDHSTTIGWSARPEAASAVIGPGGDLRDAINGQGTNTGLVYQPGVDFDLASVSPEWARDGYRHFTSDTILFHELVHANHARTGTLDGEFDPQTGAFDRPAIRNREAVVPNDRGVPREEYATVGIAGHDGEFTENKYRAERAQVTGRAVPRRGNYNGSGS